MEAPHDTEGLRGRFGPDGQACPGASPPLATLPATLAPSIDSAPGRSLLWLPSLCLISEPPLAHWGTGERPMFHSLAKRELAAPGKSVIPPQAAPALGINSTKQIAQEASRSSGNGSLFLCLKYKSRDGLEIPKLVRTLENHKALRWPALRTVGRISPQLVPAGILGGVPVPLPCAPGASKVQQPPLSKQNYQPVDWCPCPHSSRVGSEQCCWEQSPPGPAGPRSRCS